MKLFSQGRPGVRIVLSQTRSCLSIRVVSSTSLSVQSSWIRQDVSDPHQSHFCLDFPDFINIMLSFFKLFLLKSFFFIQKSTYSEYKN